MQVTAYVALGTNLGDLRENLDGALQRLRKKGLQITKVSTYIDTDPYGVTDQPRFLNAVCEVKTELLPQQLLKILLDMRSKNRAFTAAAFENTFGHRTGNGACAPAPLG